MRRDYCTYFDHRYLTKGLALYRSLERHGGDFRLYVLCLTNETRAALESLGLEHARLVPLEELEAFDPELVATKPSRSTVEYYFTCTAPLLRFVLERESEVELLTYLDADLYFFSSPEPLFEEIGKASIGIVPHRFSPDLQYREIYGRYNVAWVTIARDDSARACLERWREQCLDWCFDRVEGERFADQKYLDVWPKEFRGVVVLRHPGADLAPWNLESHVLTDSTRGLLVDGHPLVFYHPHGVSFALGVPFETRLDLYGVPSTALVAERIYGVYLRGLEAAWAELEALSVAPTGAIFRSAPRPVKIDALDAHQRVRGRGVSYSKQGVGELPRITLVTPSFNQARYLEATLRSVLDQEYPNLEYIVIDGGSSDGTAGILERYSARLSYWVSEPDRGQAQAINKGFERATGEIMGWINSDDLLLPGSLFLVGSLFREFPEVDWLTGRATTLDPDGRIIDSPPQRPWTRESFLETKDEFIQQESTFWRRSLWARAGGSLSEQFLACDFDLWARFFRYSPLHQTKGAIGAFRLRPDQRSREQRGRYLAEVKTILDREREVTSELNTGVEHERLLSHLAFDAGSWRFFRVEAPWRAVPIARELLIRNAELEVALEASEADRKARSVVIDELERVIEARIRESVVFQDALAGRIRENEALTRALEGRVDAIGQFERVLTEMKGSTSWRITAPLRTLATWVASRTGSTK